MKPVLVDSNVLLDLFMRDPQWLSWSSEQLARCADESELVINPIIYAEISVGFETVTELEEAIAPVSFRREALPYGAAFLAGKAFLKYRRSGGKGRSPLPDFYIGAHALTADYRLLSRDNKRY
ncbi:type II toxin-antitoxin system VapC family toxin [[Limnothrix rosea] IAM M-220]|uniref:type II toxin-antitoxin system VapC family toxin n=1 Tax=[Limnothrix rosea] IAM M-220 TaxID=454133 RepID=UPI00096804B5|nr:type II toxin-antitoxin system VapC family toxin [[Limnothrix rosea] IAM M-220]OKH17067.1 DNA-binding protein [[Limnothrix rosea] IAM M-220]